MVGLGPMEIAFVVGIGLLLLGPECGASVNQSAVWMLTPYMIRCSINSRKKSRSYTLGSSNAFSIDISCCLSLLSS